MSDEARRRVLEVVREHDYRPNSVARSLATDRTFEVGMLTPKRKGDAFGNSIWPHPHASIFERCMERGHHISLSMVGPQLAGDTEQHFLRSKRFDDLPFSKYTVPPLTTVHQPVSEKDRRAADLLLDQVEEQSGVQRRVTLDAELVVWASCGASACENAA